MSVIWKYPLAIVDEQTIEIPEVASVLTVMAQHGQPCLWLHVDPTQPTYRQRIHIYGTGNPIPETRDSEFYIGSVITHDGTGVWHCFWVFP
jgi:hypothetical protein